MRIARGWWPWLSGVVAALVYGLLFQMAARIREGYPPLFEVMSFGYVFILPFVMGWLAVALAPETQRRNWWYRIFAPLGTSSLAFLSAFFLGWEGWICIVMGSIVGLPLAILGGILSGLSQDLNRRRGRRALLLVIAFLPGGSSIVESRLGLPAELKEASTSIDIAAPRERVWENIVRVRAIREPITGFFYRMGFPKPIEATLTHEGVGGVRHARFEGDLVFVETITEWKDLDTLSFAIKADPSATPLTTLDGHVTVGGRYFDVLQGTYRIEPLEDGRIRLHLSSRFRVSTRFNFYSTEWAGFLMRDIQGSILDVIKRRCEGAV